MLNYDSNEIFQTSFWEKLESDNLAIQEAMYHKKDDSQNSIEGQVRETSKRTKFMRYLEPARLKELPRSSFPFEVTISYNHPTQDHKSVQFVIIYKNADYCKVQIFTTTPESHNRAVTAGKAGHFKYSHDRKEMTLRADQAYDVIYKAVKKLEAGGFKVAKETIEESLNIELDF